MADLLFKLLSVLFVQLLFFVTTFFQSLILEPAFCGSEETWETKAFLQTRGRQRTWWGGFCPRKAPIGSCSVTVHSLLVASQLSLWLLCLVAQNYLAVSHLAEHPWCQVRPRSLRWHLAAQAEQNRSGHREPDHLDSAPCSGALWDPGQVH